MRKIACRSVIIPALLFALVSCRKDDAPATTPTPPIVTDINLAAETLPAIFSPNKISLNANVGGFYTGIPANYSKTSKRYPLIVSIHGAGQYGNGDLDLPMLLNDGIPQLLDEKIFPPNFISKGVNYSFIIIAPQLKQFPIASEIKDVIDYACKTFRVDTTRIYLSGLSNGGAASCLVAATYADRIAAITPVAGEFNDPPVCSSLAKNNVAIWDFHNSGDPVINIGSATGFIASVNSFSPAIAPRLTIFNASVHDAWTKAINPSYKENNLNIYEWMLQYNR